MKKLTWMALILLSACACPRTESYEDVPYDMERTAGTGMIDRGCLQRALPDFR